MVYVSSHDWHTEIGLPSDQLSGSLAFLHTVFPTARAVLFGYGKRTFLTAPPDSIGEYLLGPFPGPAAMQVIGLSVLPPDAYLPGETIALRLSPTGMTSLSNFISDELAKDSAGHPKFIGLGQERGILFYAARSQYNLLHTCNTWTIEALNAAGLSISSRGVIFSGQAISRAQDTQARQCVARGSKTSMFN